MEPKAQAGERLLRGLGVALKTFALYPLPHPVSARSIDNLLAHVRAYTDAHGPFTARVGKHVLTVDGIAFRGAHHANLALYLFSRKVAFFKILPAVSDQALAAFVSALATDRASLDEAGGVRHLLRQAGVGNIQVSELVLEQEEVEAEPLDLSGIFEMLGRGRASPTERDRLVEVLHGGPDQARVLLESIYASAGATEAPFDPSQVEQVYQALQTLDRMVLDEPFEDRPLMYANLAVAQLMMGEPLRSSLMQTLVKRNGGAGAARLLGDHLTGEQIAQFVGDAAAGGNVVEQVTLFLRALCTDRQKAKAALAILDARLRPPDGQPNWLMDQVWPRLAPDAAHDIEIPSEFVFDQRQAAVAPADGDLGLRDARAADEASAINEMVRTLVDVLRYERDQTDRKEINDIADALTGYLSWLVDHEDYALLAQVLAAVRHIASSEGGLQGSVASGVLAKAAGGTLVEGLLSALWRTRETRTARDIRACLEALSDHLVERLIHALGVEPRGTVRAMLCDLIIEMYGDRATDLAAFVTDPRWYLVRNIANILGRLRGPQAVPALSRLVTHPDYRVRREALNALAAVGSSEAQAVLADFLEDADERLKLRAMQSLDTWEAWRAMPKLLVILEVRDPFHKQFVLKQAALEALARLGARQSLPVVKRMAGARFVFTARGRELRRLAAATAAVIEGQAPRPDRGSGIPASEESDSP